MMNDWANPIHHRLWLMGLNGRQRQHVIDVADAHFWSPIELGIAVTTMNKARLETLKIKLPPAPWYVELWQTIRWLWFIFVDFLRWL